ncbi:MAG: hypothetical protein CMH33_06830 [Microbacterium sp.]|nr:hypothetical protein [Microbacterium sp.]MAM53710.1 hypothetical protein [Microbacterium sp.]|tara:strand:- start:5068 stop:5367 length:300 start_codon:yes stop_codon:yes gene_type:complete
MIGRAEVRRFFLYLALLLVPAALSASGLMLLLIGISQSDANDTERVWSALSGVILIAAAVACAFVVVRAERKTHRAIMDATGGALCEIEANSADPHHDR